MKVLTLFDKIWDSHVVSSIDDGPVQLYIDRHYCHEVTSPQAFDGLRNRGLKVFRPQKTFCTADHNTPTMDQDKPVKDTVSRVQLETLKKNAEEFGLSFFGLGHEKNGIVHVVGPENGLTLPGMTIVCGDSHTSTHGAFGCVAFGVGTSEVEMTLATQCILQPKPLKMRIIVDGKLGKYVTAKDVILYIISKIGTGGATGYFIEYAGETIRNMSMEERMTVCNMSIEAGARGGMIAPDEKTFEYLKGREYAPEGEAWDKAVEKWKNLKTDEGATFDKEIIFNASSISPMITYGTNPGTGISVQGNIPEIDSIEDASKSSFEKMLDYMGFVPGEKLLGKSVDYVFLGSCTNGRIEDFRMFAEFVKGKKKAENITAWIVPGSKKVEKEIIAEGLNDILNNAGFEIRQPGCSACLAMNDDKIPAGKYAVSTSNRNFEGRQGPGSRTLLTGPLVAAATAITGVITDPHNIDAKQK
ncbi:MAG: 3-isopropylmalate dehydratase large subunit [Prevotellaceae bacterium]|jgi:3-isopropylmalate/(R)-2-methylmalate dehydratase large subunit|nr:3-isopropylmalate dehydratase large subunit [Prevotellaceae bacterium]